jgi:enoyl-CoA hydratase/carnithine racemase
VEAVMLIDDFGRLKVGLDANGRVLRLEFDHGKVNEMGAAEIGEFEQICARVPSSEVRAIVSTSRRRSRSGKSIFVAGANVTERLDWSDDQVKRHVRWQRDTLAALRRLPVFHVCVVDGLALGWGTEYLLTADYVIAGPNARMALPETGLGILPGAGGTSELWATVGPGHALRLGMTGEQIDAAEAVRVGLAHETADSLDEGIERALALASKAAMKSPTALAAFKAGVLEAMGREASARRETEALAYEACVDGGDATIGRVHFSDVVAGRSVPWNPRSSD